jgi:hypothetical protein
MSPFHRSPDALESEFIVRGDVGAFGRRLYLRDRVIAESMEIADRLLFRITFPRALETHLQPGQVAALVLTAPRDGATVMAVLDHHGGVHVHPELPRMNRGMSLLVRLAFGRAFFAKLEGVKQAVALLARPAGGGA